MLAEIILVATTATTPVMLGRERRGSNSVSPLGITYCLPGAPETLSATTSCRVIGEVPEPQADPFTTAIALIRKLESLTLNWNSHGAEPPSKFARYYAESIILASRSRMLIPMQVAPSAEGGVAICFSNTPALYIDIECFNDGEAVAIVAKEGQEPDTWPLGLDRLEATLERITAALA